MMGPVRYMPSRLIVRQKEDDNTRVTRQIRVLSGKVKDFKLNTQCSAGNGYFLQSTATNFGYDVKDYADAAFKAESMPMFGYGCAVFMQSDIVNFQRQGWTPKQIMAGLADVLPKNIWLYVAQIPNLARLGTRFQTRYTGGRTSSGQSPFWCRNIPVRMLNELFQLALLANALIQISGPLRLVKQAASFFGFQLTVQEGVELFL